MPRNIMEEDIMPTGKSATTPRIALRAGKKAPDFTLKDTNGNSVTLSMHKGKTVVLYFYPKDDTPGCTLQACNIRDNYATLKKRGIIIYGISPDPAASHQKFTKKYSLPFPLLSDEDHRVSKLYGTWGEKTMYGKKYQGMFRHTYIIGPDMTILAVFNDNNKVKVEEHSAQILQALDEA